MGVIQRQGIKQSLLNFAGVGVAALSTIFIYPLSKEAYGLARFLIDTSLGLMPFLLLGLSAVSIRFFPQFRDEQKRNHGWLGLLLLCFAGAALIFTLIFLGLHDRILALYRSHEFYDIFRQFMIYLLPIGLLIGFIQLLTSYTSNFQRIVVTAFWQQVLPKLTLPLLILLYLYHHINMEGIATGLVISYAVAAAALCIYLWRLGRWDLRPDWEFARGVNWKEVTNYAMYGMFTGIGSVLALRIDSFMVTSILDFEKNGAYNIAAFIGNAIAIPTNAVGMIAAPLLTAALQEQRMEEVKQLYRQSSLNLLVFGLLVFIGIMASVEDLFALMPGDSGAFAQGTTVVLFIGLAKVIDMGTSVNNQIINFSRHFRFGLIAIVLMAVFNIVANLIFIPRYQIAGAALATLASLTIYNLIKLIFIKVKFGFLPFSLQTLKILLIAAIAFGLASLLPDFSSPLINIFLRSLVILIVYSSLTLYFRISPDVNQLWDKTFRS